MAGVVAGMNPNNPQDIGSPTENPPTGVGTISATPSGTSKAVPATSFDQAAAAGQYLPYEPFEPGNNQAGAPASPSLQRLQTNQWAGQTGQTNAAQTQPFGSQDTYVTVPVDKVVVAPNKVGQVEPEMGTPANVHYGKPRAPKAATTPSTAAPTPRYGGQVPGSAMPPYTPTTSASKLT